MINQEDIDRIQTSGQEAEKRLLEYYLANTIDPITDFLGTLRHLFRRVNRDIEILAGTEDNGMGMETDVTILNRDDRVFERIMTMVKEAESIKRALALDAPSGSSKPGYQAERRTPDDGGAF